MIQNHQDKSLLLNRLVGPFLEQPFVHYVSSLLSWSWEDSDYSRIIISTKCSFELNDAQGHFAGPLYVFIDDIVRLVFPFGRGYLMANTVIKNAFRIIPMIPLVYHLLWFSWNGNCYSICFYHWTPAAQIFFQI